jgi:hypothetical protein
VHVSVLFDGNIIASPLTGWCATLVLPLQAHAGGEAALTIYDLALFDEKRIRDFFEAAVNYTINAVSHDMFDYPAGIAATAPDIGYGAGTIGQQSLIPAMLLWLYRYYGNVQLLKEHWNATRALVDALDPSGDGCDIPISMRKPCTVYQPAANKPATIVCP